MKQTNISIPSKTIHHHEYKNSQITTTNDGSQLDSKIIPYQSHSYVMTYNKLRKRITHKKESYAHHLDVNETEMSRNVLRPIGYKGYWKKGYFQNLLC